MTSVPPLARRLSRLAARAYGPQARDAGIPGFLDDAIADAWARQGWRGIVAILLFTLRDLLRVWTHRAALPVTAPAIPPSGDHRHRPSRITMSDRLSTDIRHAFRALRRTPGFTAVSVITLALGIGASTAVYAVVDGSILRPFSYPDMRAIAILREINRENGQLISVAWQNFLDWRARNDVFRELGIYRGLTLNLAHTDAPERVSGALVSASIFQTTGMTPLLGRAFTEDDDRPGVDRIAIVSERLWRTRLGADPAIVGQTILLNNEPHAIVGVMPAGMRFPSRLTDVWLPLGRFVDTFPPSRGAHPGLTAVGRLRPGVTFEHASAAMDTVAAQLAQEYPDTNRINGVVVESYYESIVRDIKPGMQMLLAAVGLLLLIACANLTGLLLARSEERQGELAIRAALGAGRGSLLRQLLVEAGLLAATGGALGVLVAHTAVAWFLSAEPTTIPRIDLIAVDWPVLAFAAITSAMTVVIFGALPALRASRPDLQQAMTSARTGASLRALRARRVLVAAQVAVAVVLLVGAGLLYKSLARLLAIDVGFDPTRVVTMRVAPADARYPTVEAWSDFYDRLIDGLAATAGIEAIGINSAVPLEGGASEGPVMKEGDPPPSPHGPPPAMCTFQTTGGDYFGAMGIPVIHGRTFDERDRAAGPLVAIVDESLVARLFPGVRNPVGRRVAFEAEGDPHADFRPIWREIVGVVGTVKHYGLIASSPYVQVYVPHTQPPTYQRQRRPVMAIAARAAGSSTADSIVASVRSTVARLDPTLPVYAVQPMQRYLDAQTEAPRLLSGLLGGFALLAGVLTVVGVYGLLAYLVALRRREIGVRIALGARAQDIMRQVVGQGLRLTAVGLVLGIGTAVALSRYVETMLYEVSARDAGVYAAAAATLAAIAAAATAIPARRASSVDPVEAIRTTNG
jgi:putative ABC transport system permease protein